MKIVVASGKGGTGKTTIATAIAHFLVDTHKVERLIFVDVDVEAPNAHLFLKPIINQQQDVNILVPEVDETLCSQCGRCVEVCQFHALALVGKRVLVFPQLCHGCGSCTLQCPEKAISEQAHPIGMLETGQTESGMVFAHGVLTISEPMAAPIIRQLKRWERSAESDMTIIDSPPGASCSVVEAIRGVDFALLVTEPTPFGLHDLGQVVGVARTLEVPVGVIINRDGIGNADVEDYCRREGIPVLMRVPYDPKIAVGIAAGELLQDILPAMTQELEVLISKILILAGQVQRSDQNE